MFTARVAGTCQFRVLIENPDVCQVKRVSPVAFPVFQIFLCISIIPFLDYSYSTWCACEVNEVKFAEKFSIYPTGIDVNKCIQEFNHNLLQTHAMFTGKSFCIRTMGFTGDLYCYAKYSNISTIYCVSRK